MFSCEINVRSLCTTIVHSDTHTREQFLQVSVGLGLALVFLCVIFVLLVFRVSCIFGLLLFYVVSTSAVDCLERPSLK